MLRFSRQRSFRRQGSTVPKRAPRWLLACLVLSGMSPSSGARAQEASPDEWDIEDPHAPTVPLAFTATEGTWISVDVSPDGEHIVFDLLGHIYEMPFEGGVATPLTQGRSWNILPRYSPDGAHVAFTSDRNGTEDLWVLDLATSELRNVSDMPVPVVRPTWAASGDALYGTSLEQDAASKAFRFNLFGESQEISSGVTFQPMTQLVEDPRERRIFFEHLDQQLHGSGARIKAYDMESGETAVYRERPGGAFNPTLSPDGRTLAYGNRDDQRTVVLVHDLTTRQERVLIDGLDRDHQEYGPYYYGVSPNMAWHPDGQELVLTRGGKIVAVNVATEEIREIPFEAPVNREINETMRFEYAFPEGETRAWSYRWAHRTPVGVVFEALGDIWILENGVPRNVTESPAHETSPVVDADRGLLYYASWTDAGWGQVNRRPLRGGPPSVVSGQPSQYGSLALASDGTLAFVRGKSHLADGGRLETEEEFELVTVGRDGGEAVVTDVTMTPNTQGRHPVDVRFGPDGRIYYTEFLADTLVLRRVEADGDRKTTLYRFPHGEQATLSPDLKWIAFREYHRSYLTPFEWIGNPVVVSGLDGVGFARRIDAADGSFLAWSDEGTVSWPRGGMLYEKAVEDVMVEDGAAASTTDIGITFPVATPTTTLAFTNARVITMDSEVGVLEGATVIVEGNRIAAVGIGLPAPEGARVFDASGHTIMPGMVDAHAHPDAAASPTLVVEQRMPGILAGLAHGVTTMVELYGTEEKDPWVLDMITAGKMDGPRLLSVGAPMYGLRQFRPKTYRPIASYEEAEEHVLYSKDQGIPVLKDYVNFTRADRHQLATAARQHGLNLVAETAGNSQMNYTQIIDGLTGLEHSMGVTPLYQDVVELFRASEVGVTPTLLVVYNGPAGQSYFDQSRRVWEDEKLLRFSKEEWLRGFRRVTHFWEDDLYAPEMAAAMKELFDEGVLVNAGGHGQMLGRDMHWELELFVQGGFTPLEALQVATINGAEYHGLGSSLGSIEVGKLADLVVLAENPLDDIRNTEAIRYVVKDGIVYDGSDASRVFPDSQVAPPFYFQRVP